MDPLFDSLPRRAFLKLTAIGLGSSLLRWPAQAAAATATTTTATGRDAASPVREIGNVFASEKIGGDEYHRPHEILWQLDSYIASRGGWPSTIAEERDVVIIGGGMSGLLTAYSLRDTNWTLLEQGEQLGGNSRAEEFAGRRFSIGAAYITIPDPGSQEETLLKELGLFHRGRIEKSSETRVLFGDGLKNLWRGETDPAARASADRIENALREVNDHAFPDIPWREGGDLSRAQLEQLDQMTAEEWLLSHGQLHGHVREYFQVYAWSAFGGSLDEISAAQFLNFAAPETDGVLAFEGGNAAIAEALQAKLRGPRLRTKCLVLDVREQGDRIEVLIEDESGELRGLRARAAVMTAPKYVAIRVLRHMAPPERIKLWKSITYRAYAVANVRLKGFFKAPAYDVFRLKGQAPSRPTFGNRSDRFSTDFIYAGWARESAGTPTPETIPETTPETILTLYRPYPLDGARNILMGPTLHERLQREFATELREMLPSLGIAPDALIDLRVALWGHSVPLAKVGRIADGSLDQICAPLGHSNKPRLFFANQDDSMNPAFESCLASALRAAHQARVSI